MVTDKQLKCQKGRPLCLQLSDACLSDWLPVTPNGLHACCPKERWILLVMASTFVSSIAFQIDFLFHSLTNYLWIICLFGYRYLRDACWILLPLQESLAFLKPFPIISNSLSNTTLPSKQEEETPSYNHNFSHDLQLKKKKSQNIYNGTLRSNHTLFLSIVSIYMSINH